MKITYVASVDVLRILFNDAPIARSEEMKPGVILDYAEDGSVVGMEILNASYRVSNPGGVEFSVIGMR
ncbi:MAG: DUF2283 domain-containing protein [Chloroflexi bacterium]|nr:DUF2283 domain-containing protein [Chloroflexota bacterium]